MLDKQTGLIHLFKKLDQNKPDQSISLFKGTFPDKLSTLSFKFNFLSLGLVSDPITGQMLDSFEFKTKSGL